VEPERKSIASKRLAKHKFPQEKTERNSIASQRLAKHTFPQEKQSGSPLLANGSVSTFP
jgi:hypothetical protein